MRTEDIYIYIKNKDVLDVGYYAGVGENIEDSHKPKGWIHEFLTKHAKSVIGIDIEKENIEILRQQGYNLYNQNAESFKFNKKFDTIFAGDLIEHLSNPGLFLNQCKKHLKKDGWLIIVTPNVFSLNIKISGLIRFLNNNLGVHPEHTCFFSPALIKELLRRYDFGIKKIEFVNFNEVDSLKKVLQDFLCRIFGKHLRYSMMVFVQLVNNKKEEQ